MLKQRARHQIGSVALNALFHLLVLVMALLVIPFAYASDDLAAKTQNPISSMISLPFEFTWDNGAPNGDATIMNVQPVVPITLEDWNLVNRLIVPVVKAPAGSVQPGLPGVPGVSPVPGGGTVQGIGDINYSLFFSPVDSGPLIWGVGPSINLPTATDGAIGSGKWSLGPTAVFLTQPKPWTFGALVRQLWSVGGQSGRKEVSQLAFQPFVNYNLDDGWYLWTSPTLVANWRAKDKWTVPLGGGFGRIFNVGDQPINARIGGEYNVIRPDPAPEWSIKFTFQFLFPK